MAIDGRLNFDTKLDTKGFTKGVNSLGNQIENLRNIVIKMGAALGTVFSGKEALEAAADINAANSQMQQTFGNLKSAAEGAMKSVADNSSILQTRLQNVGTSIYAFAKTAGMDSVSALKMMEEALQVTADSAAYYDRSLEDTAESLKSFLKGNFENDAALGLSCTETTRNAAANKLYGKSYIELSEAQKQLTLLQMVKDANALSGAEGQAAREADGWENVIGNLKESWRQLLAVIGQPVLSAAVTVVKSITTELQKLTAVANSAVKALSEVFGIELMNTTDGVADSSSQAADNYTDMAKAAEETQKANENSLASFDQINKLGDDSSSTNATDTSSAVGTLDSGTISTSVDVDISDADKKLTDFFKWVKSSFKTIFDPFKTAWSKNGEKVIDSAKQALNSLKGMFSSIGSSLATVWNNGTGEQYISNILRGWEDILGIIGDVSNALKNAWNDNGNGTALIQSYMDSCLAWQDLLHKISDDFRAVWNNGTGEDIFENIIQSLTNINNTVTNLKTNFQNAWSENDTGKGIIQDILDIFNDILSTINSITADTRDWAAELDFSPLLTSVKSLLDSIEPLSENVGDGLEWFWDNVLLPMAGFTIENVIPDFLDLLSAAIDTLNSAVEALKPLGKWLWDKFLKPLATWTGSVITAALNGITSALNGISDWIKDHQTAVENFAVVVGTLGSAFAISGIIQGVVSAFAALAAGTSVLTPLITALGVAVNFLTSPITLVCLGIGALIAIGVLLYKNWETVKQFFIDLWDSFKMTIQQFVDWVTEVWTSIKDFFAGIWQGIKDVFAVVAEWFTGIFQAAWDGILSVWNAVIGWFSNLWTGIKDIFSAVGSWFGDIFTTAWTNIKSAFSATAQFFRDLWTAIKSPFIKVADWFKDIFSKAWQAVKDVFSTGGKIFDGIKEGITGVFTTVVNGIIGGINKVISTPLDFLNGILNDIRDIEIAGFTPFDEFWDYDPIPVPQIPMLATGAVIPPNSEFLAVLGDQKRGTNIEVPLDTIKQALFEALAVYGGAVGNQKISVTIPIEVKGRVLSQIVIDDINDFIKRNGKSPIKV